MSSDKSNSGKNKFSFTKKNKIIIAVVVALVLVIGISTGYIMNVKSKVGQWEGKIYPGVQAYGVDLSGKTKEEAIDILNNELIGLISNKVITVTVGDKTFELSYSEINPTISSEETIKNALEYGKDEKLFAKKELIENGSTYSVETVLSVDEEKLHEFALRVNSEVKVDAVDATISINSGNISVTPEVVGKQISEEELCEKIKESVNPDPTAQATIEVVVEDNVPRITAEALNKITGVMSSFSSSFGTSDWGRVENLKIASGYINGTVLMPGDEFSYNETIGPTTPERGYKEANTYVGNEIVPGYGGGVCQVSSTLYRAVIQANIRSTERRNHSMTVGYAKPSLDATVAAGYIDYKFVNTYDFPIYLEGYVSGNQVVFKVYGNKESMGGKTYELVNEILETYNYETEEVKDANLEEGKTVVESSGAVGYKSKGYLITYENGVKVDSELISTDVYQTRKQVVKVGTKKVEIPQEEAPTETPAETTEG